MNDRAIMLLECLLADRVIARAVDIRTAWRTAEEARTGQRPAVIDCPAIETFLSQASGEIAQFRTFVMAELTKPPPSH